MATIVANTRTLNISGGTGPIQWRKLGDPAFRPGPPLWNGKAKLIMLEPDTDYEVLVNGVLPQVVRTRSETVPKQPGGRTLEATPATMAALVPTLLPGDTLQLRGGLYRLPQGLIVSVSGTEDNYITLEAYPGEEPVLTADPGIPLAWTAYSGPVWQASMGGKVDQVWEGDRLLWRYNTLADLIALQMPWTSGLPGGFYHDKTTGVLYLSTSDAGDPTGREFHVTQQGPNIAGQGHALQVTGSYIELKGLKVRWVSIPILLKGRGIIVDGCSAYATHYMAVTGTGAARCVVRNCQADGGPGYEVYKRNLYGADWAHGRGVWFRRNAESFEAYGNEFSRLVEGISGFTYREESNPLVNPNVDIHHNEVSFCYDDGMEVDGAGVNFGAWENKVHDCYDTLSLAPLKVGPAYIFKNQFWHMNKMTAAGLGDGTCVKDGAGSQGLVFFFHNTVYGPRRDGGVSNGMADWANGAAPSFLSWDNIISVSKYITTHGSLRFRGDYNILWSSDPTRFIKNSLTAGNLARWQAMTGYERHSLQVDPGFRSPPGDLTPSQGINLGTPGPLRFVDLATGAVTDLDVSYFEDALGYAGAAPDMGAIEVGGPPPQPIARLSASPLVGYTPLDVTVTDQSLGPIDSWLWDFGDGSSFSGQQPPIHRYPMPGVYAITLTVTGPGGSGSTTISVEARQVGAPIAAFTADMDAGVAPLAVQFTDRSTGVIDFWQWRSGDGQTSTARNHIFTYTVPGSYMAQLTVTGPGGTSMAEMAIAVLAAPLPPVAAFTPSITEGPAPLTVAFTNESVGEITSQTWDFGDGASSEEVSPAHIYTAAGDYTVRLTVTGPGGSDDETAAITVLEPALPGVSAGKVLAGAALLAVLAGLLRRR